MSTTAYADGHGDARGVASHELLFSSLFHPGRGVAIPCDPTGAVNLDALTERLRNAYLGARAMLGREYAYPVVVRAH